MTEQQPPTPSVELLSQWCDDWDPSGELLTEHVAMQAALWGWQQRDASVADELQKARDEELEACCEWVYQDLGYDIASRFQAARRPKSKSLAEEALKELTWVDKNLNGPHLNKCGAVHTIRRALEQLQKLEGQGDG